MPAAISASMRAQTHPRAPGIPPGGRCTRLLVRSAAVLQPAAHVRPVRIVIAFGAGFGNTVMARVSLLIGRVQFLCYEWWPVARAGVLALFGHGR